METKKTIKETILRLLESHSADMLSVKMVCMEAGISKQTLYNHYYGVMDALEDAYNCEFMKVMENSNTYENWDDGVRNFLEFLREIKSIVLHLYNSSYRADFMNMIQRGGERLIDQGIADVSRDIGIPVSDKDKKFMLKAYNYYFMGITDDYIKSGMAESPEYIAGMCEAMLGSNIRNTISDLNDFKRGKKYDKNK